MEDIEEIIAHRYDNGADYWTTEDRKLLKGAPFTTLESPMYLLELGVSPQDAILTETAELIFSTWREDGRFKTSPSGGLYPCHTALALRNLCVLGYAEDQRLLKTFDYFISTQQEDRGWKCNKYSFGRGPETEHSTPMTTLTLLDAFRYSPFGKNQAVIHPAIEFLLTHWRLKSQSVLVIMALARCSCRRNILLGDIISFIICMFYPFTLMRNEMSAFGSVTPI